MRMEPATHYRYHVLRTPHADAARRGVPQYLIYNGKDRRGLEGVGYRCLEDQVAAALQREVDQLRAPSARPVVVYDVVGSVHNPGKIAGVIDVSAEVLARATTAQRFVERVETVAVPLKPVGDMAAATPCGAEIAALCQAPTRTTPAPTTGSRTSGLAAALAHACHRADQADASGLAERRFWIEYPTRISPNSERPPLRHSRPQWRRYVVSHPTVTSSDVRSRRLGCACPAVRRRPAMTRNAAGLPRST